MNENDSIKNGNNFDSFDDKSLAWECIEPIIEKIRAKNISVKSQVYAQLTIGQQSLLLFWILYGHAQSGILQFFKEIDYILSDTNIWNEMKDKFNRLQNADLLNLILEIENTYKAYYKNQDHLSADFLVQIHKLDKKYNEIIPSVLKQICHYIRNNPKEYV